MSVRDALYGGSSCGGGEGWGTYAVTTSSAFHGIKHAMAWLVGLHYGGSSRQLGWSRAVPSHQRELGLGHAVRERGRPAAGGGVGRVARRVPHDETAPLVLRRPAVRA